MCRKELCITDLQWKLIRYFIYRFSLRRCSVSYLSRPKMYLKQNTSVCLLLAYVFAVCLYFYLTGYICIYQSIYMLLLVRPSAMTGLMEVIQSLEGCDEILEYKKKNH